MKKAIALVIGMFLTLTEPLLATEEQTPVTNQYGYLNLGLGPAPLPIPQFGGGYRFQNGSHGFDANVQLSTVVQWTGVKVGLDYLYYLKPDLQKQFYVGVGPAVLGLFEKRDDARVALAPELIFGKQYTSDTGSQRHFQANMMWPTMELQSKHSSRVLWYPVVSFSYGWGF